MIPVARKLLIAEGRAPADHRIGVRLRQHRSGEIRPVAGEWHPRMPERLDQEELVDWRASRRETALIAAPDPRLRRQEAILVERSRYAALMADRPPTAEESAAHVAALDRIITGRPF